MRSRHDYFDIAIDGLNVDFYFGRTGHILEQYANNKLIRPRAGYIGKGDQKYVPIGER